MELSTVYVETEEAVSREVQSRLSRNPYHISSRKISYRFADGILSLHGSVPTYYLKQVAQTIVAGVDGVSQIDNQIEVTSPSHLG